MKLLHVFLLLSYQPANAKTKVSKPVQKIKKKQNEKIRNKNAEHFEVFQTENSLVAEKRKQLLKSLDESIGVLGKFKKSKIVNLESRVNAIRGYCEGFDFKNAIEISQKNNDQDLKKKLSDTRDICTSTLDFMKTEQMNLRLIEMKNGGKLLHEFIKDKNAVAHCEKASMLSRYTKNINDVDNLFVDVAAKNYWKNKFKAEFIENELAKAVNVLSEASMLFITKQCENIDTNALAENVLMLKQKYVSVKMIADMEEYEDFENAADNANSKIISFDFANFDEKNVQTVAWITAVSLILLVVLICAGYGRKDETIIVVNPRAGPQKFSFTRWVNEKSWEIPLRFQIAHEKMMSGIGNLFAKEEDIVPRVSAQPSRESFLGSARSRLAKAYDNGVYFTEGFKNLYRKRINEKLESEYELIISDSEESIYGIRIPTSGDSSDFSDEEEIFSRPNSKSPERRFLDKIDELENASTSLLSGIVIPKYEATKREFPDRKKTTPSRIPVRAKRTEWQYLVEKQDSAPSISASSSAPIIYEQSYNSS